MRQALTKSPRATPTSSNAAWSSALLSKATLTAVSAVRGLESASRVAFWASLLPPRCDQCTACPVRPTTTLFTSWKALFSDTQPARETVSSAHSSADEEALTYFAFPGARFTRFMPQIGHWPGPLFVTSGCIEHVQPSAGGLSDCLVAPAAATGGGGAAAALALGADVGSSWSCLPC